MTKETILVLCAHNDDQVIGAGGALAKYANSGIQVKSIIFSFGESSHPHLKPEVIIKTRIRESLAADKIIKGSGVAYLGLTERKFREEFVTKKTAEKIKLVIAREKPIRIFTHSLNDPHPDHRAVAQLAVELLSFISCPVNTFEIWTPFRLRNRYSPKLFVDISDTFATKMRSIHAHESQRIAITNLLASIYLKAKLNGLLHGCKYAEVFDQLQ